MAHIRLKPSKQINIDFDPKELDDIPIPAESQKYARDYMKSKKLAEDDDFDLLLMFEDKVIFGFDYLHQGEKRLLVELNPVTIFYANSVMSFGSLKHYRKLLFAQSRKVNEIHTNKEPINFTHSGIYFQIAINCVINLQATLESFANRAIPENYQYVNKNGNPVVPTITYKLNNVLPNIKNIDFQIRKNRKYNICIDTLIKLRNDIIHLKPTGETNTGYKGVYRDLLNFDFAKAILSVRTFINFYEPNLIEECECGMDFGFYQSQISEQNGL